MPLLSAFAFLEYYWFEFAHVGVSMDGLGAIITAKSDGSSRITELGAAFKQDSFYKMKRWQAWDLIKSLIKRVFLF